MTTITSPRPGIVPTDSFGLRLVMVRHFLDLSQEEAAKRCGLKPSTWATWEDPARPRRPRGMDEVVKKIANGLGCDRGWLMFGGPLTDHDGDGGGTTSGMEKSSTEWYAGGDLAPVVHLAQPARAA